jgi:hypothetical protein
MNYKYSIVVPYSSHLEELYSGWEPVPSQPWVQDLRAEGPHSLCVTMGNNLTTA